MDSVTMEQYCNLLKYCTDAAAIFDDHGQPVYRNPVFQALPESLQQALTDGGASESRFEERWTVHRVLLNGGSALIAHQLIPLLPGEQILSELLLTLERAEALYPAVTLAVHKALGWRWVSISRFREDEVEVLAHCSDGMLTDAVAFELAGAPCEVVARTGKFTLFSDVASAFPDNPIIQQLGGQCYAGLVYTDEQNKPIGHIMAIHDQREVDYRLAEQVLALATLVVSSRLMLDESRHQLNTARHLARVDGLTQLYNRACFDEYTKHAIEQYQRDGIDTYLALIDLDHFKRYNDSYGHCAGDQLLKMLAVELMKIGREADTAFRIGGDEFAILFPDAGQQLTRRIERQFHDVLTRLSLITGRQISASIGFSKLSECQDAREWHNRADIRMYQYKRLAN